MSSELSVRKRKAAQRRDRLLARLTLEASEARNVARQLPDAEVAQHESHEAQTRLARAQRMLALSPGQRTRP